MESRPTSHGYVFSRCCMTSKDRWVATRARWHRTSRRSRRDGVGIDRRSSHIDPSRTRSPIRPRWRSAARLLDRWLHAIDGEDLDLPLDLHAELLGQRLAAGEQRATDSRVDQPYVVRQDDVATTGKRPGRHGP